MATVAAAAIAAAGAIGGGMMAAKAAKAGKAAAYDPVDIGEAQAGAINANQQQFGAASRLAGQTNAFNQGEATRLLEQAMPGYSAIQSRLMSQINADLDSQTSLPSDVQDRIARFAAEKGITRGTGGNFNSFSLVKDFGFNLIDWQNAKRASALNTLSTVFGMAPRVNPMSPSAMFVDPNAAIAAQAGNSQMAYNIAQSNNNAQAAAANQRASIWGGVAQSVAGIAGGYVQNQYGGGAGSVRSQTLTQPDAAGNTMTPYQVNARPYNGR